MAGKLPGCYYTGQLDTPAHMACVAPIHQARYGAGAMLGPPQRTTSAEPELT